MLKRGMQVPRGGSFCPGTQCASSKKEGRKNKCTKMTVLLADLHKMVLSNVASIKPLLLVGGRTGERTWGSYQKFKLTSFCQARLRGVYLSKSSEPQIGAPRIQCSNRVSYNSSIYSCLSTRYLSPSEEVFFRWDHYLDYAIYAWAVNH